MTDTFGPPGRILALDLARTGAICAMVVFHFGFDLQLFGLIAPGTMTQGFWFWFARGVAASFLVIAGISLWLAHGDGIRWRPFLRRWGRIVAGAALVTAGTRIAVGPQFVFFGILHSIAVASLIGLLVLRLPPTLMLIAALAALGAPHVLRTGALDVHWLTWTGLTTLPVQAVDFVPVFPWAGMLLAGVWLGRVLPWDRLRATGRPSRLVRALGWPGRHSLALYLIHQPVLLTGLALAMWLGIV